MSDIFLSYASADLPRVKTLVDALQQQGWSVWWDRSIRAGKTWDQVIEAALADARCVVVVWSQASIQSDWVRTEAEEGKRRGILVPVLLDNVTIPLAFRRIQAANLVNWTGTLPNAGFDDLVQAISEVLSGFALPKSTTTSTVFPAPIPSASQRQSPQVTAEPQGHPAAGVHKKPSSMLRKRWMIFGLPAVVLVGIAVYRQTQETGTNPGMSPTAGEVKKNSHDGLDYVWIPPGRFIMGCSGGDNECEGDERPAHEVIITRGFWMGKTEVTVAAYRRFRTPPSQESNDPELPVVNVIWEEGKAYCAWAGLHLPTEAEWEYSARAGTTGARYGALDEIAWHRRNSTSQLHAVARKKPNAWGLHDMLGNTYESTADWYGSYAQKTAVAPTGSPDEQYRIVRGGSWFNDPEFVRVSFRGRVEPADRGSNVGFRCAGELR